MAKKVLHPTLKANADRLSRGEPIHKGGKRASAVTKGSTVGKSKSAVAKTGSKVGKASAQKPKIRSKQKKG